MRSNEEISAAIEKYGNVLYRTCLLMLKNTADTDDVVEETYITYMQKAPAFSSDEHEKAWLITVAVNKCRNIIRYRKRHLTEPETALDKLIQNDEKHYVLECLMLLQDKFRIVMTLHYIDGYKVEEIAAMINKSVSAVKMRLHKGRNLLIEKYRKEYM